MGKVIQELNTLSFLTKKTHDCWSRILKAYDKACLSKLEPYIASSDRKTCLVLTASSLHRASLFYKKIEKHGVILDIAEEKPWEKERSIVDWLLAALAKENKQAAPHIAQLMVKQIGTDQALLHTELCNWSVMWAKKK